MKLVRGWRQHKGAIGLRMGLRHLYEGNTLAAHRFRYAVLAFDLISIVFVVVASFLERATWIAVVDVLIGAVLAVELASRLYASRRPWRDLLHPVTLADIVAVLSFLAPLLGEGLAFLRIFRTLRLIHSYRTMARLRHDFGFFRKHEEAMVAALNLAVFLFVMTALVYETQHRWNPGISSYADALYFTVTTLTTTGFGDITLPGTMGRLLSVVIMLAGVTLFVRLAQTLFRPAKIRFTCPSCGLQRHEPDAVHCKACGVVLNIPNDDE